MLLICDLTLTMASHGALVPTVQSVAHAHNETNITDEMCATVSVKRQLVQTMFVLLKPLLHSAVLTGTVFPQFKRFCNTGLTIFPCESLYSRYSNLTSPNTIPKCEQKNQTSLSPNSGGIFAFKFIASSTSIALLKAFSESDSILARIPQQMLDKADYAKFPLAWQNSQTKAHIRKVPARIA
jgi:hypothetical protein